MLAAGLCSIRGRSGGGRGNRGTSTGQPGCRSSQQTHGHRSKELEALGSEVKGIRMGYPKICHFG